MAFKIIRNDITKVSADAIVNTANPMPVIGSGTDSAVYTAAGKDGLLAARKKIGDIECGTSAWTDSFELKKIGIKYIIHAVGTFYNGGNNGETETLRRCYSSSLNMAKELGCKSIAIPLLGTGNYSFPKELALQTAIEEISSFLLENEMDIMLVVYDTKSYLISAKLFDAIQTFIDENYTGENRLLVCEESDFYDAESSVPDIKTHSAGSKSACMSSALGGMHRVKKAGTVLQNDVNDFITQAAGELNFQNTLQKLIAERNLENAAVYKKTFIDRKFFSKIISTKNYIPKKTAVMALGLALELDMEEYVSFLASAGYAFMPSSKFDLIIKYCVMHKIYNMVEVNIILDSYGEKCFCAE